MHRRIATGLVGVALLASPSPAAAGTPWPGWGAESISVPGAHPAARYPSLAPTPDGSAVAAWIDADGAVEVSRRDLAGHWQTQVVAHTWVVWADASNKGAPPSPFTDRAFGLQTLDSGQVVLLYDGCPPTPGQGCIAHDSIPVTSTNDVCDDCPHLALALADDGTWRPTDRPPPLPPRPVLAEPSGPPGVVWTAEGNDTGRLVAVALGQQGLLVARGAAGLYAAPDVLSLPMPCNPGSFGLVASLVQEDGSAILAATCTLAGLGESGDIVPDELFLYVPATGEPQLTAIPGTDTPWSSALSALPDGGGVLLLCGSRAGSLIYEWDRGGRISAPVMDLGNGCNAAKLVLVDPDRRVAAISGSRAAFRDAAGGWSAPVPLGFTPAGGVFGSGPPALVGIDWRTSLVPTALGTDAAAPVIAARPGFRRYSLRAVASNLDVRGAPLPAVAYAWQRCRGPAGPCTTIPHAARATYWSGKAGYLRLQLTARNAGGVAVARSRIQRLRRS